MQAVMYNENEHQFIVANGSARRTVEAHDVAAECPDIPVLVLDKALRNPGVYFNSDSEGLCR